MVNWLDKYDDVPKAENGIEGTMGGLTDVGFNYNGAWGGTMQNGGLTFLEPTSRKLPKGYVIPYNTPSTELAMSIGGVGNEPAYLIPSFKYGRLLEDPISEFRKTGEHLGGPFKTYQEADEWERTVRHPYVEKGQSIPTPLKRWGKDFAMGGSVCPPGFVNIDGRCFDKSSFAYKQLYKAGIGRIDDKGVLASSTMDLPEIVIQPRSVREWSEDKFDVGIPGIDESNRYAFGQIGKKYGFIPNVKSKKEKSNNIISNWLSVKMDPYSRNPKSKASYDTFGKKAYADDLREYYAELAHHADKDLRGLTGFGRFLTDDLPAMLKGKNKYKVPGTSEYVAHEVIEPKIREDVKKFKEEYSNKFDRPEWITDPEIRKERMETLWKAGKLPSEYKKKMGGGIPGAVGFTYARTGSIPANGPYAKKTKASAQNGKEMKYYQEGLDFKPKTISQDGSIVTPYGQWEYPGEITTIPSNEITMQGVPYPVLGISDIGDVQMMYPGQDYTFDGKNVTEYPMAQSGKSVLPNPYFKSPEERDAYRKKLTEVAQQALATGSDENLLINTSYHNIDQGNNCINGICGLNIAAGLKYNNPTDQDRFLSGEKFAQAVAKGQEDYYQVDGNFQIGDQLQYRRKKGSQSHNKIIYDVSVKDDGEKIYKVIDNAGGKTMKTDNYTESELKKMQREGGGGYNKVNIYRPGYNIDKSLIEKERYEKTSPEARRALNARSEMINWETSHNPGYKYSIREDSKFYKDAPEGMKKFIEFANDDSKINNLVEKLGVDKGIIHDELLNTFGELGQENKWQDPLFGRNIAPDFLRKLGIKIPLENTVEKIFKPKSASIGPGQIKFNTIDPELKKKFNIDSPKDLYNFDKIIPLMTAMNIKNRKWMENKGDNLSEYLVGKPGVGASELKGGVGRLTPYMYRGSLQNPEKVANKEIAGSNLYGQELKDERNRIIRENASLFDKGSYADNVFRNIDENLQRTLPGEMQPIIVTSKRKKQRNGGVNKADEYPIEKLDQLFNFTNYNKPTKGGWLDKY